MLKIHADFLIPRGAGCPRFLQGSRHRARPRRLLIGTHWSGEVDHRASRGTGSAGLEALLPLLEKTGKKKGGKKGKKKKGRRFENQDRPPRQQKMELERAAIKAGALPVGLRYRYVCRGDMDCTVRVSSFTTSLFGKYKMFSIFFN